MILNKHCLVNKLVDHVVKATHTHRSPTKRVVYQYVMISKSESKFVDNRVFEEFFFGKRSIQLNKFKKKSHQYVTCIHMHIILSICHLPTGVECVFFLSEYYSYS